MKQYFLKTAVSMLLLSFMAAGAMAQQDSKDKEKSKLGKNDMIIVKSKSDKDSRIVIEIKDGDVIVNGKPLAEFKDDDIVISRRKELDGVTVIGNQVSRFRGGGWNYNSDRDLAMTDVLNQNSAFLGVTTEKTDNGAKINSIAEKSAAEKAGLKKGDVITRLNETKIEDQKDLTEAVGKLRPDDKVTVTIKRDGKEQKMPATLGRRGGLLATTLPPFTNFNYDYSFGRMGTRLGLKAQETEDSEGLKVLEVEDDSPANNAGIKEDDIITEFDGTAVNDIDKLRELSRAAIRKPSFKVKVLRNGKTEELTVKIPRNLKTTDL